MPKSGHLQSALVVLLSTPPVKYRTFGKRRNAPKAQIKAPLKWKSGSLQSLSASRSWEQKRGLRHSAVTHY